MIAEVRTLTERNTITYLVGYKNAIYRFKINKTGTDTKDRQLILKARLAQIMKCKTWQVMFLGNHIETENHYSEWCNSEDLK